MTESKLIEETNGAWKRSSVMLIGPSGIGKTVSGYEAALIIAKRLGRTLVEYDDSVAEEVLSNPDEYFIYHSLPLVECEPTDISGHPRLENGHAKFFPFLWMTVMQKCPGMLVLDDFLDVQRPDLFSAAYKVTLERRFGFLKYNDGVMVVGASNTAEYSSLSNAMPAPLANRFIIIPVDPPTVDEWHRWMTDVYGDKWNKTCYVFLKRFESEGYILKVPPEPETVQNFPTHRTWTRAAVLSYYGPCDFEGLLGPEVGQKFEAFCKVNVNIEEIIETPERWNSLELDAKYMACAMLASWLDQQKKDVTKALSLIDVITSDSREYFALVCNSVKTSTLSKLILALLSHDKKKYNKLTMEIVGDRSEVLKK